MVAGENFGILDDSDPVSNHVDSTSHLADQIENAGLTWKAYEEGMGAPCGLITQGRYTARHDPFVYFNDVSGWDGTMFQPSARCNAHVVDYSQLDLDLADNALPSYAFITPDLDHDMHDGTIAQGDQWLAAEVPKLLGSEAFNDGGVIFLLWDEGGGSPPADDPPFLAISPNARPGFVSLADYDTSAFLKTVESALGVAPLPCNADAAAVPTMSDLFSVALTADPLGYSQRLSSLVSFARSHGGLAELHLGLVALDRRADVRHDAVELVVDLGHDVTRLLLHCNFAVSVARSIMGFACVLFCFMATRRCKSVSMRGRARMSWRAPPHVCDRHLRARGWPGTRSWRCMT